MEKDIWRWKNGARAVTCPAAAEIEERIIGILLLFPELYSKCDAISHDDFVTGFNKQVYKELSALYSDGKTDISAFNEIFSPEQMSRIYDMKHRRSDLSANGISALNEQISALKTEKIRLSAKQHKVNTDDEMLDAIELLRKKQGIGKN